MLLLNGSFRESYVRQVSWPGHLVHQEDFQGATQLQSSSHLKLLCSDVLPDGAKEKKDKEAMREAGPLTGILDL